MIILEKFEKRNCEYHNLKFFSKILNLEDYYKRINLFIAKLEL